MQNSEEVRVAPNGDIRTAPLDSPVPTLGEAFDPVWNTLGLVTDAGVNLTAQKETGQLNAWQTASPVLYFVQAASLMLEYTLEQWNQAVLEQYFDADWTVENDIGTLLIAANPDLNEHMLALTWEDQNQSDNMLIVRRGLVTNRNPLPINRTAGVFPGLSFSAEPSVFPEDPSREYLAALYTNDPAVVGSGS